MNSLDVDLTLPIALLVSAIAGVIVVRMLVARGESVARERTRQLLERHRLAGPMADRGDVARPPGGGASD